MKGIHPMPTTTLPVQRALERGDFRHGGPQQRNHADMKRVCSVAHDIASGMASLHKRNVVHGGAQPSPRHSCARC